MLSLTRQQVREVDRRAIADYGMSGLVLMENAGRGVADVLERLGISGTVAICCGKGNNGGDGFVVARHLDLRGFRVQVLLVAEPDDLHGDAAVNFAILHKAGIEWRRIASEDDPAILGREFSKAQWLVDALLGTGAQGEPRPPLAQIIQAMNRSGVPILAVDLPSGLDCDTGEPATPTIRATHTCTFVAAKLGFSQPAAQAVLGQLHTLDIGAPRKLLAEIAG